MIEHGLCENPRHRFEESKPVLHMRLDDCINWKPDERQVMPNEARRGAKKEDSAVTGAAHPVNTRGVGEMTAREFFEAVHGFPPQIDGMCEFADAYAAHWKQQAEQLGPICYHCGNQRLYKSDVVGRMERFGKNPKGMRCTYCDDWLEICSLRDQVEALKRELAELREHCISEHDCSFCGLERGKESK